MAKLMVRGYRPTPSADGTGFALVGATQDISVVRSWIDTNSEGLFLHAGFEHLKGDVIRSLIVEARKCLVVCAASRILLGDSLPSKAWRMIVGNEADRIHLHSMGEWFFKEADGDEVYDTFIAVESVLASERADPETNDDPWSPPLQESLDSEHLVELLKLHPEASLLMQAHNIKNDADFLCHEHKFPAAIRLEFAEIVFSIAEKEAGEIYHKATSIVDIAAASLRLAQAAPAWIKQTMPFINSRMNNALRASNIESLAALSCTTPEDLARTPNVGRKSIDDLLQYLRKDLMPSARAALAAQYSPTAPVSVLTSNHDAELNHDFDGSQSLAQVLEATCTALERANQRQGFVLRERIKGRVLEDIAPDLGVTRERIRQISVMAIKHLNQIPRTDSLAAIELFFDNLYASQEATPESQEALFKIIGIPSAENKAVLNTIEAALKMDRHHLGMVTLDNVERIIPLPNNLREITDAGLDNLISQVALRIYTCTADEARLIARGEFLKAGLPPFLAELFSLEVIKTHIFKSPDGTVTGQTISPALRRQMIMEFFRNREAPANWQSEGLPYIEKRFPRPDGSTRYAGNDVHEIRKGTLSSSDDYLFSLGYGDYGLWKHIPLNDFEATIIANEVSAYLEQYTDRQFTDKDLLEVLNSRGIVTLDPTDRRSKHYISAALFRTRHPRIRYMGRYTWSNGPWTDEPDTENRLLINSIISDAIRDKGRPMWLRELRDAVQAVRGHGTENFQVYEKEGVIRLTTTAEGSLYWDTALDPYPLDSEEARNIQSEIIELLSKTAQMSVRTLKASMSRTSDWVAEYNDAEFFSLALRIPGVEMTNTQSNLSLRYAPITKHGEIA